MAKCAAEKFDMNKEKHADELVLGVRLLHHVLKKYPDNPEFAKFLGQLDDFKDYLKTSKQKEFVLTCRNCTRRQR